MPEQGLQLSDNALWHEIENIMAPGHGDRAAAGASLANLDAGRALARTQSSLLRAPDPVVAVLMATLERRVTEGRATLPEPRNKSRDPS